MFEHGGLFQINSSFHYVLFSVYVAIAPTTITITTTSLSAFTNLSEFTNYYVIIRIELVGHFQEIILAIDSQRFRIERVIFARNSKNLAGRNSFVVSRLFLVSFATHVLIAIKI